MEYISTRNAHEKRSAAQAIVQGLSTDGGLFVPAEFPQVTLEFIDALRHMNYPHRVASVLSPWLSDFSFEELLTLTKKAYTSFDVPEVVKTLEIENGLFMLELWHGPTLAFKDMALQLMPHLLSACAQKVGESREILILVATSGDTGKAALEGFHDVPGTAIAVFYPEQGVSEAQKLQMVTQEGKNAHVIAVQGNFDDAQTGVKRIFSDVKFADELDERGIVLSSANSINLGRLLPQVAYYFSAYADMLNQNAINLGDKIDVCVPTGNFGNILAASYAREMGLPIRKLICASNANNVLADFIKTGVYDSNRAFHLTTSPSMDILISSNLERMLFELVGERDDAVRTMMQKLKSDGYYKLDTQAIGTLRSFMDGGWADESAVKACIRDAFEQDHYLLDPHTAVALSVLKAYQKKLPEEDTVPALVVSTASPYKFGRSVLEAITNEAPTGDDFECCRKLAELAEQSVPSAIAELPEKPVLHTAVCLPDSMKLALSEAIQLE